MSDADKIEGEEAPVKPKSKVIPLLLVVNTLLLGGVMVFTLTRKPGPAGAAVRAEEAPAEGAKEHGSGEPGEAKPGVGPTVALENFVVQLKAVDAERYAHLGIDLEVQSEDDKNRVSTFMPRIRDAVISYLADRTADELRGSAGMTHIKEEILLRVQKVIPGRRVIAVYVTDFIVQ